MKALVPILIAAVLALTAGAASASPPKSYSAAHQPSGKPTKASSFAPHPGGSHRHVYGAPIQSPIFHSPPKDPPRSATPK